MCGVQIAHRHGAGEWWAGFQPKMTWYEWLALFHFSVAPPIPFPPRVYDSPLPVTLHLAVNKNWGTQKWYKPELLTPMRISPETLSFSLFLRQHETKSNGMKNMTWQHHLYYNFSHIMNFSPKTMPFTAKRLAYFCPIVNCKNYALVFGVYLYSMNSWANISTQKQTQNWED